ncbi:hypothetical protein MTO96_051685 [Rhipicephalus appendiculatus]
MFLLAALLATALPESQNQAHGRIRRLLYFIWFLSILSLSVYIRGEITALVTVTGPADHLDTLDELESALDRRTVAPCVVEGTSTKGILARSNQKSSSSLLRKLNAAYWRESGDSPVVQTPIECLFRAGRADRVCFLAASAGLPLWNMWPEAFANFKSPSLWYWMAFPFDTAILFCQH